MSRVDPVHVYGLARLRKEYLARHPGGGDFKAFLERFTDLRDAVHGKHKPVRFYGLTFGQPASRAVHGHARAHVAAAVGGREPLAATAGSLPKDEAAQLALLHKAGLATDATTLADALAELELPFMFAGREQFVENLKGAGSSLDPRLRNVSMESPVHDPNARALLLGRAQDAVAKGKSLADDFAYWQSLVPSWAPKVRDQLEAEGIPFSVELLASPEINLTDPSKPLFGRDAHPTSLSQLGVDQAGEQAFLRSLSAEELMTQIWPLYYQYYHRPAGAPVPEGFEAGLTFGSGVIGPDGKLVRSPVMDTEAYKRWSAYGQPGTQDGGWISDALVGIKWNPLTGEYQTTGTGNGLRQTLFQELASGQITPDQFGAETASDVALNLLGSRVAAAAALHDPSLYFAGPLAPYGTLSDEERARFEAL